MRAGWFRRRTAEPTPPPAPRRLDALVNLGDHHIPVGATPGEAVAAVTASFAGDPAVALAGWVSVQHHPYRPVAETVEWVERDEADDARSDALRAALEACVGAALLQLAQAKAAAPPATAAPFPNAAPLQQATGFAEAPWAARATLDFAGIAGPIAAPPPADTLSDAMLLQRLLRHATGAGSGAAAPRAIDRFGSLAQALAAPGHELLAVNGLGEHSVAAIKLVHAIVLRSARAALIGQPVADNWDRLLDYLRCAVAREKVEQFRILFLDGSGRLTADEAQARGTVNHTPVYPREVIRRALELRAASLILVHNHPGGDPSPSTADIEVTAQIEAAGRVVGVSVFDHVIVVTGRCLSFREEGLLSGDP